MTQPPADQPLTTSPSRQPLPLVITSAILFTWSLLCALFLYYTLTLVSPGGQVIAYPFRMINYLDAHPLPYFITLSGTFALVGATWLRLSSRSDKPPGLFASIVFPAISLFTFSILGALLWVWHDILHGYMPPPDVLRFNIMRHLPRAPQVILYMALLSMPLSSLALAVSSVMFQTTGVYTKRRTLRPSLKDSVLLFSRRMLLIFAAGILVQYATGFLIYYLWEVNITWELILYRFLPVATGILFLLGLIIISLPWLMLFQWTASTSQPAVEPASATTLTFDKPR